MTGLDPRIAEYYERGEETARLSGVERGGALELVRTQELILRHLPEGPLSVLDVGGGPGVYAKWLVDLGHHVRLVDPVPLHLEQARARDPRIVADVGDARALDAPDASADVVLLLGPLYHLTSRSDRVQALAEARRVLRPGGVVAAAAISRFAALLDLLIRLDRIHEPKIWATVEEAVRTGVFDGHQPGLFTTAYFHQPEELLAEVEEAGLAEACIYNVEGPGFMLTDLAERWDDAARRKAVLDAARLIERESALMGAASHLLVTARSPS